MILTDLILDLLFPPRCLLCGGVLETGTVDLCRNCREQTARRPDITRRFPGIDSAHAVWYYEGSVRDSLLRYKFSGKRGYASGYGRILALSLLGKTAGAEVITWVPVSEKRKRQRGYDQAELLAKSLGRELGLPVAPMLCKGKDNPAQSGLTDFEARKANVRGVYTLLPGAELLGKRILLVDDILTTGSTASECARTLKSGGAAWVCLAVMASGKMKLQENDTPEEHSGMAIQEK